MKFISTITVLVMSFSSVTSMAANPLNPPQMGGGRAFGLRSAYVLGQSGISTI